MKSCVLYVLLTSVETANCVSSQQLQSKSEGSDESTVKILDFLGKTLSNIYTVGLQKNATIQGSIIEGEGDFGATFGVKTGQFTCGRVASLFWVGWI